ncbi:hypothetical protein ACP4OV_024416 [Aristida adscensionis]
MKIVLFLVICERKDTTIHRVIYLTYEEDPCLLSDDNYDERPYHSHIFREPNGSLKLDCETEKETKHNICGDKMVEQTNHSENGYVKSEHQNGIKTELTHIEDVSYDKDVVEIKLPETVLSSDYGSHFVKDVCVDEGVIADQKTSTEKLADQNVPVNFDASMGDKNGDLREEIRSESAKSADELKSKIVVLPVMCATDNNSREQYSHDLEATAAVFNDLNDEKLGPKQLLCHEDEKGCQRVDIVISESNKNQESFLNGESTHEVYSNDCHETGIVNASETSNIIHSDLPVESTTNEFSAAMLEEVGVSAAFDKGESNQVNHYNPFIAYGSLDDTWEPKYSLPTIVDAASIAPICPVEKTDSFSDLINRALGGFDSVEIAEAIIEEPYTAEASSSTLDAQVSEDSNDQRESLTNEMKTSVGHGTGMAASLSNSNSEPSDIKSKNQANCEIDSAQDVNDFNPRDVEVGTKRSEDKTDSKSSTVVQTESVVQQNGPDSARLITQSGLRNPFESSFSGPSITSGPLTPSGHIPYSGNISLRSESSTTSTRSFAFPVDYRPSGIAAP